MRRSRVVRAVVGAVSVAVAAGVLVVAPSFACYWESTGPDSWVLRMEESDHGSCSIGAPPSSGPTPTPEPSYTPSPDPMPSSGGGDTAPEPEPTASPTPTPTPTPTGEAKPDANILKNNDWLNVETPTQTAIETQTIRKVTIASDGAALEGIVLTADDDSAAQICPNASSCSLSLPDKSAFTWMVFNPTYFKVGTTLPRASALNKYTAIGSGTANGDVTITVTPATGAAAIAPVDLSGWQGISGWTASTTGDSIKVTIPSLLEKIELKAKFGPLASAAKVTGLPDGLSFDPATGTISGTPKSAGTASALIVVDDLQVPVNFQVSQLTYTLRVESAGSSPWYYVRYASGGNVCSVTLPCVATVPLGAELQVYGNTGYAPITVQPPTASTGLSAVLSKTYAYTEYNSWSWRSQLQVTANGQVSADPASRVVVLKFGSGGTPGVPYSVRVTSAGQNVKPSFAMDDTFMFTVPSTGKATLTLQPHPALSGAVFQFCSDPSVVYGADGASITVSVPGKLAFYCEAGFGGNSDTVWISLDPSALALKPLPILSPQPKYDFGTMQLNFTDVKTLFAGWDLNSLPDRVSKYLLTLSVSSDGGGSYWDALTIYPSINAQGVKFSNMPTGWYQLKLSFIDKLGAQSSPQRVWYWQKGTGVATFDSGGPAGMQAFLNSKVEVI